MKWEKVKLGDILDLKNGFAFKSDDYVEKSNTLNCRMSNIRPGGYFDINYSAKYLPDNYVEKYSEYLLKDGDLIVAMTDLANDPKILGVPTIVKTNGYNILLNQRVGKLVLKDKKSVCVRYLKYALNRKEIQKYFGKFAGGGLQINLGKSDLLSCQIPLPPLHIQVQIADTLDKADALRRKDQELLQKYDELAQAIFYDMFGDPEKNERGYKLLSLDQVCLKINDGTHHTPKYTEDGVPFLRVTDITESNNSKKFISLEEHLDLIKRCKPEKGDVLYTKNGTIGKAKEITWDYEFSIFVSLCLLKPRKDIILPKFLETFLNTPMALKQATKHSKTGTITNLHLVEIKKIKIPVPNLDIQAHFTQIVNKISLEVEKAENSKLHAGLLFDQICHQYFS